MLLPSDHIALSLGSGQPLLHKTRKRMEMPPFGGYDFLFNHEFVGLTSSGRKTPKLDDMRRMVPSCAICGADSTGIHFGVDACAACSAFFRRTVVLDKRYSCTKMGHCSVLKGSTDQKCRACRFSKCISQGMDRNSVQQRRDAIGKYSENVRKESIDDEPYLRGPPSVQAFPDSPPFSNAVVRICDREALTGGTLPTTSTYHCQLEPSPNNTPKILVELIERQKHLYSQRHLFYSDQNVEDWFREPKAVGENELYELNDFTKCMFHLWRVEPRLAAEFMNKINVLDQVPDADKLKIYKNFVVVRQVVEEPYTTWKHGGLENKWFVWTNRRYIDFNNPEKYFRNGAMKGLKLDLDTTQRLFIPSFLASMDNVGGLMKKFNLAEVEMVFLLGLSLFDPSVSNLTEDTRKQMKSLRDRLVLEMFDYIQEESTDFTPEVRLADLFSIVAEIKIHAIKCAENMQILRVFNLIPEDPCFEQMLNKS